MVWVGVSAITFLFRLLPILCVPYNATSMYISHTISHHPTPPHTISHHILTTSLKATNCCHYCLLSPPHTISHHLTPHLSKPPIVVTAACFHHPTPSHTTSHHILTTSLKATNCRHYCLLSPSHTISHHISQSPQLSSLLLAFTTPHHLTPSHTTPHTLQLPTDCLLSANPYQIVCGLTYLFCLSN